MQKIINTWVVKFIIVIMLLSCVAFSAALKAQENYSSLPSLCNATVLTLPQMVQMLRNNNPQLLQAYYNYLAAKAQAPQLLAPNNPIVGAIRYPQIGTPPAYGYTLSESMPFFGKKRLAAAIANDQTCSISNQNEALTLQLINELKINFFQLLLQQQQEIILNQTIQRLELLKQISKTRYANNAAAFVDYLNAQTAQNSAKNDLFALNQQIIITRSNLNVLIGRSPNHSLQLKGAIALHNLPLQTEYCIEQQAMVENPNLRSSTYQIAAAENNLHLSRLGYFPDFNVTVSAASAQIPSPRFTNASAYGVELDLTLPIWFYRKENFGVAAAKASLISSHAANLSLQQQTQLAVTSAYASLHQAIQQSNFIATRQLPQASQAFRLALTNYATYSSVSSITFADLLTAQNNLQQAQLALADSNVLTQQSYANLEAAVGGKVN